MSLERLPERLDDVRARIAAACARAGRAPEEVTLVAVAKTHPVEAVREAVAAGQLDIGENYAQELRQKQQALADASIRWHFVGRLQRNKAKDVVGRVVLIHALDSAALAAELQKRASAVQDVLIEVNVGGETTKGGVTAEALPALLEAVRAHASLRCTGLMTMPPPGRDNRKHFRTLARLARQHGLAQLSMGMSDDFETAIEEGATLVRIGTALFGPREG